jgi:hypothetical protein
MATTADPLVGFRCSFVLWASGSGLQARCRDWAIDWPTRERLPSGSRLWFSGLPAASISVALCRGFGVERADPRLRCSVLQRAISYTRRSVSNFTSQSKAVIKFKLYQIEAARSLWVLYTIRIYKAPKRPTGPRAGRGWGPWNNFLFVQDIALH